MTVDHPLDRPVWNMLTGRQAALARGDARALRIDPGYGPFAAAREASVEAQAGLGALLEGDRDVLWLVEPEEWPAPPGTRIVRTAPLLRGRGRLERRQGATNVVVSRLAVLERPDLPAAEVRTIEPPPGRETGRETDHAAAVAELRAVAPAAHSFGRRGR